MPSFADANSVLSGFVPTDSAEEPNIYPYVPKDLKTVIRKLRLEVSQLVETVECTAANIKFHPIVAFGDVRIERQSLRTTGIVKHNPA